MLSTLMAFLEDKDFLESTEHLHFEYSDWNEIAKAAKELFLELKLQDCRQEDEVPGQNEDLSDDNANDGPTPSKRNFSQELRKRLADKKKMVDAPGSAPPITSVTLTSIKRDMKQFEGTGRRPRSLEKIYQALRTIQVTSCEAERSFRQDLHMLV